MCRVASAAGACGLATGLMRAAGPTLADGVAGLPPQSTASTVADAVSKRVCSNSATRTCIRAGKTAAPQITAGMARAAAAPASRGKPTMAVAISHGRAAVHRKVIQAAGVLATHCCDFGDFSTATMLCGWARAFVPVLVEMARTDRGTTALTARLMSRCGEVLHAVGQLHDAEPLLRESLDMRRRLHGSRDHSDVALGLNNLALVLQARGDLAGAEPLVRESLDMDRRLHGSCDHSDVAVDLNNLAQVLQARGDLAGAEPLARESLDMQRRLHGSRDHSDVALGLNNLARVLQNRGDLAGAEPLLRESPGQHHARTGEAAARERDRLAAGDAESRCAIL